MRTKLTLLVFDGNGIPVGQTTISGRVGPAIAVLVVAMSMALAMGLWDYFRLKSETAHLHSLHTSLWEQKEQIVEQKDQILAFSRKIDQIYAQLADLQDFEKKIRILANLEAEGDETNIFGMGGSDPEQSDPAAMVKGDYPTLLRSMHAELKEMSSTAHNQQHSFSSIFHLLEEKRSLLAATPSIRPVSGWISSGFGYRSSPFTGRREFHRGLDIATHPGTSIIAPADGTVTFAGNRGLMGKMVTIDHGFGMVSRYGHVQKTLKQKGERVKRGETIALVGSTGRSTGPHLHYEVLLNGVPVNPMNYFLN